MPQYISQYKGREVDESVARAQTLLDYLVYSEEYKKSTETLARGRRIKDTKASIDSSWTGKPTVTKVASTISSSDEEVFITTTQAGNVNELETEKKTLVEAINEVLEKAGGLNEITYTNFIKCLNSTSTTEDVFKTGNFYKITDFYSGGTGTAHPIIVQATGLHSYSHRALYLSTEIMEAEYDAVGTDYAFKGSTGVITHLKDSRGNEAGFDFTELKVDGTNYLFGGSVNAYTTCTNNKVDAYYDGSNYQLPAITIPANSHYNKFISSHHITVDTKILNCKFDGVSYFKIDSSLKPTTANWLQHLKIDSIQGTSTTTAEYKPNANAYDSKGTIIAGNNTYGVLRSKGEFDNFLFTSKDEPTDASLGDLWIDVTPTES